MMNCSVNCTGLNASVDNEDELYEVPSGVIAILSLFYGLISVAALVGNSLVIYVVIVSPRMRTVTNFYIANLAFADCAIALFAIPFQFHAALLQRWDLPEFMCQFCPFVQILSVNISIFTLVAISLDRYRAIMYPLRRKPTKMFSKLIILLIWVLGLAFALPMGLAHKFAYVDDDVAGGQKPFCFIDFGSNATTNESSGQMAFYYYSISLLTVEYFVPLAVITVAYARIAIRLWGNKTPGAAQTDRDHNILLNKKKVIKMLVIVVCIFAVCWMPWQTYMTAGLIWPGINNFRYINIIFFCCHWLAMSNSCYNPFIYGVYSEKFRREFSTRLPCLTSPSSDRGNDIEMAGPLINSTAVSNGARGHRNHTTNLTHSVASSRRGSFEHKIKKENGRATLSPNDVTALVHMNRSGSKKSFVVVEDESP